MIPDKKTFPIKKKLTVIDKKTSIKLDCNTSPIQPTPLVFPQKPHAENVRPTDRHMTERSGKSKQN
jgi:hypothetical protein